VTISLAVSPSVTTATASITVHEVREAGAEREVEAEDPDGPAARQAALRHAGQPRERDPRLGPGQHFGCSGPSSTIIGTTNSA